MDQFVIKSKVYSPPDRKDKLMYTLLNIAVVLMAIYGVGSLIINGLKIRNIISCVVVIVIGLLLKMQNKQEGHYDFCVLSILFQESHFTVSFGHDGDKEIHIAFNRIRSLEYSDQLECLRMVCDYEERNGDRMNRMENAELLLYISYEDNQAFYNRLEERAGQRLLFVDR